MKERAVARVVLPFDLRTDWQRKLRFRDSLMTEVATRLRELPQLSFDKVSLTMPLLGEIEVSFDQVPPVCRHLQAIPNEVELQVVLVYADDKARDGETGDNDKAFWQVRTLPAADWEQYWERIYVAETIKRRALNYSLLAYKLGKWRVSNMCLAQHRIVLFYGPPGTGKTSLARGLANQAARIFSQQGEQATTYVEVDAHKLTSKWLGESQKLIEDAFNRLLDMANAATPVVCVLDEVESLLTNRSLSLNEGNPVDVYRAVNAVLQLVDRLSERPNVFMLATSNLTNAIDPAFADRVDISFYIDVPPQPMREAIFADIARELREGIAPGPGGFSGPDGSPEWDRLLEATEGYSGRQLRKLVLEALTADAILAQDPARLTVGQIYDVVAERRSRTHRDAQKQESYQQIT